MRESSPMQSIWETLGDSAASEWHVKWSELRRSAGLSVQASNTYSRLIDRAAPLALEISNKLKNDAQDAINQCVEGAVLANFEGSARAVTGALDQSVSTSLRQLAGEYDARRGGAGIRLHDYAVVESEKVTRHLAALEGTLAKRMAQRAEKCSREKAADDRAQSAEVRARRAEGRARVLFWLDVAGKVGILAPCVHDPGVRACGAGPSFDERWFGSRSTSPLTVSSPNWRIRGTVGTVPLCPVQLIHSACFRVLVVTPSDQP